MNSKLRILVNSCVVTVAATACSQGPVNIGDNQTTPLKTGLAAYAANWEGYVEVYQFTDKSDRVHIAVREDGTGSVRFGDRDIIAPATDASANYPPEYSFAGGASTAASMPVGWAGFEFGLNGVSLQDDRLRASAASKEIFGSWCRLQTSREIYAGIYSCVTCDFPVDPTKVQVPAASDAGSSTNDTCYTYSPCVQTSNTDYLDWENNGRQGPMPTAPSVIPQSCELQSLCELGLYNVGFRTGSMGNETCKCDALGCNIVSPLLQDIKIDVALDATQRNMTGTLALGSSNYTIRLKRQ